jgi:hypothetical protein
MLNDTTKPGEVLHKGGLDLLTLLHRRDVELHAHLTLWCSNDDQQRCEHMGLSRARRHRDFLFEADRMTGKISAGGDRLRVPRGREIPATPAFVVAGFPAPLYERENRGAATPTVATASCSCVERKTPPRIRARGGGPAPLPHLSGRKFWSHRGNACRR